MSCLMCGFLPSMTVLESMACNIYTFLVGIDNYPSPITPLQGCVNDIDAFEQYLHGRVSGNGDYVLQPPHRLINEQATRQALIDGFRTYLGQAQSDDVALFYYSGHGSQAPSPPEFWVIEPDRCNETLVCWDSRLDGQWDLADKELAGLIAEVSQKNPHIIVILDCCHSGTGTRSGLNHFSTRHVPADIRQRPFDTFWQPDTTTTRSAHAPSTSWKTLQGRHILLAACRENEEAREFFDGNLCRGAFSHFLVETLKQVGSSLTYRDLFNRTYARVCSQVAAQSPQLEATHASDLDQPFLGGAITPAKRYHTVSYNPDYGWIIDSGAVHGLAIANHDYAQIIIYPFDVLSDALGNTKLAIARADIITVHPHLSQLRITQGSNHLDDTQAVFKALLSSVPIPAITVSLAGDTEGIQLVRQALKTASPNDQPSPYVREVVDIELTQLKLIAQDGVYRIQRYGEGVPLPETLRGYTANQAMTIIRKLEHIARWMTVADLINPGTSRIPPNALQIEIYHPRKDEPITQSQIYLTYEWDTNKQKWQQPSFRIKLTNQSGLTLFCALYDLTEIFEISSILEGSTVRLGPGEEVWVAQGQPIYGNVPKSLWQEGVIECHDILKAIACTADFDATLLEQDELSQPLRRSFKASRSKRGTLNHLMQQVMTRKLSMNSETDDTVYDDWMTNQITFTVTRPQTVNPINAEQTIDLGQGVILKPHPGLQGNAHLTTMSATTRELAAPTLPPIFYTDPQVVQPLELRGRQDLASELNVLELKDLINTDSVTSSNPLTLLIPTILQAHDYILPIAFDGEFFLPLGKGQRVGNKTEIRIERLPQTKGNTRSLGSSIRIFFQKIVAQKLGLEFPYPLLAAVDFSAENGSNYDIDRLSLTQRVAKAQTILLYIHGILGDVEHVMISAHQTKVIKVNEQLSSLIDLYDLVLVFDYETLNTPIGDLAKQLENKLKGIGLNPNHGKTLHIVAHSLGGLVARSFIEQQAGSQIVQHLFMLGTPNAGSPWSTIQDWATATLTIGLNSLSSVALPVKALGSLMAAIELVDVTLDQMKPESDFLKSLASSSDPGVPYTVIIGNASIISLADNVTRNKIVQLLDRIGHTAVEFPFLSQPNDLMATVYSMKALPPGRSPSPKYVEVACHHLNYLTDVIGLQALSKAVIETDLLVSESHSISISSSNQKSDTFGHPNKFWIIGLLMVLILGIGVSILIFRQQSSKETNSHISNFQSRRQHL